MTQFASRFAADEKSIFNLLDSQRLLQPGETPEFNWFKDGAPYDPEERFKVQFTVKLLVCIFIWQQVTKSPTPIGF